MKDALNNDIIFGNRYGYSRNENGFTYVRLGKIVNSTPKGLVTMLLDTCKVALYNSELKDDDSCTPLKISIKPNMLFPI